uniref:Uncharacterized protein n=1 Tax=Aegilops tauschii subsp. strangulata TaxID=200361 RepID=A0A453P9D2_AEGTS
MASNSSAAAVAALFGIREGHQQDQMKPLLAQHQRQHVVAPPSALLTAGPDQAAAAAPPVKKKRTMPGMIRNWRMPFLQFHSCMHSIS